MVALWCLALLTAAPGGDDNRWQRVVALLEYVEGDYPAALASGNSAELSEQHGLVDEVVRQLEAAHANDTLVSDARALVGLVEGHDARAASQSGVLARRIIDDQHLVRAPRHAPDLSSGATLYAAHCAACHGADGLAQTDAATTLSPPPISFHDRARMARLTPARVFDRVTFGVPGTAMVGIPGLSDDARWAVSFYTFTLRQGPCSEGAPEVDLATLANSTDEALASSGLDVSCARRVLRQPTLASLDAATSGLRAALEHHRHGDSAAARQAVVDAYLTGVEPVEPLLRARNPALVAELEERFTTARLAAQRGEELEPEVTRLLSTLERARGADHVSDFWSVFVAAALILLREGFEAVVVVGALLAALKKLGAQREARVVHAGWVTALGFGALAFVFGQRLFAGANREWLESLVALGAVGLLLYAALWLNSRTTMSRFMGQLREKMGSAVSRGSLTSLFIISFSSVGRESIETALFLQGLATDSRQGATWGAVAGLVLLLGLVGFIRRVGFALPMKTLFAASTVVLVVTAVGLLGKGLHGLQELGVLPLRPMGLHVSLDMLGLFPDFISFVPQVVLAVGVWYFTRPRAGRQRLPLPGDGAQVPKP